MRSTELLAASWTELSLHWALPADIGRDLLARYAEPQRVFHTAEHLAQVLALLRDCDADPRLQLAAWFHDAVYVPGRSDNEARSAALADRRLAEAGATRACRDAVCAAVLATAGHASPLPEVAPLLDADLAILGAAPAEYAAYRQAIRREFASVPAALFARGRAAFLRAALARERLYATSWGHARFEAAARRNLAAELAEQ
jgi:predicted metal-dependent HD superfamily phosphohydrolase